MGEEKRRAHDREREEWGRPVLMLINK